MIGLFVQNKQPGDATGASVQSSRFSLRALGRSGAARCGSCLAAIRAVGGRGRAARRWGTFIHQTALRMPDPGTWAPGCHGLLAQCPVSCWPGPWVPALGCGEEPGLRPFLSEWLPWAPGSASGAVGSRPPDVHVAGREGDRCGKGVTLGGHALIPRSWLLQNMPGLRSGFLQARCPQKTGVLSSGCSVG